MMVRGNYTQIVVDQFYDLAENLGKVQSGIWKELGSISQNMEAENWAEHYASVVKKYHVSGRFALLRIITRYSDAEGSKEQGCTEDVEKNSEITIEQADRMSEEELEYYKTLLMKRIETFNEEVSDEAEMLVQWALSVGYLDHKSLASREELLRLGHYLDLDLSDMQFLLVRTLGDNEVGLRFGLSEDVIDMFGFVNHLPLEDVQELKDWYRKEAAQIRKVDYEDKPVDWTQDIAGSFEMTAQEWTDGSIEKMKDWLKEKAPYLDLRSKTALRVFRNLAGYAYCLCKRECAKGESDLYNKIAELSSAKGWCEEARRYFLDENGKFQRAQCRVIANEILRCNWRIMDPECPDRARCYHDIHIEKGAPCTWGENNKGIRNSRTRIQEILEGEIDPKKGDMLLMLWFIANNMWSETEGRNEEYMSDFIDSADIMLENALLPEFYPPNVLEYTMMMSIAVHREGETSPAAVYEDICSFTPRKKATKKRGSVSHSKEEKLAAVLDYLEQKEEKQSVEKIAEQHGVSESSLNKWMRAYREGNLK